MKKLADKLAKLEMDFLMAQNNLANLQSQVHGAEQRVVEISGAIKALRELQTDIEADEKPAAEATPDVPEGVPEMLSPRVAMSKFSDRP